MPLPQKLCALLVFAALPAAVSSQVAVANAAANPVKVPISVVLTGIVKWTVGSTQDSGNVTLTISADGSMQETWNLAKVSHSSKQGPLSGSRDCEETGSDGKTKPSEDFGCYRPVTWFAPWIGDGLVATGSAIKTDTTSTSDRSLGQTKTTYKVAFPGATNLSARQAAALQGLIANTSVDVVSDATTLLPVRIAYQDHPDSDPGHNTDVDVIFADYRLEGGFNLPHHIQRYLQHSLQMDLEISSVTVN